MQYSNVLLHVYIKSQKKVFSKCFSTNQSYILSLTISRMLPACLHGFAYESTHLMLWASRICKCRLRLWMSQRALEVNLQQFNRVWVACWWDSLWHMSARRLATAQHGNKHLWTVNISHLCSSKYIFSCINLMGKATAIIKSSSSLADPIAT